MEKLISAIDTLDGLPLTLFGQIDDIGVAFNGRKFFKLQVVVAIGVICKLDYAAETVFLIVVKWCGFLGMDFFDLCGGGC